MIRIMFICHGNICRSPMAEFYMKYIVKKNGLEKEVFIASSATSYEEIGNDVHFGTKKVLKEHGIPYSRRSAIRFEPEDYSRWDYIVLMDKNNYNNLFRIIGTDPENKVHLLLEFAGETGDIADPWYTGNFEHTFNDVERGCNALLKNIFNVDINSSL